MSQFPYYYGREAEQFTFYQFPKAFIRDPLYSTISTDAKLLYSMLRDRMSLSREQGWIDEYNRVYIIYTVKEIARDLGCSERKAISLMAELDTRHGLGLIEKQRQGLGQPDILYVKNFIAESPAKSESSLCENDRDGSKNKDLPKQEGVDTGISDMQERAGQDMQECAGQDMQNLHPSNTDNNNTNNINTNNPSLYLSVEQAERMFKKQICYDVLLLDQPDRATAIDGLIAVMSETFCTTKKTVRVNGDMMPTGDVRSRLMKIDMFHIQYILDCLDKLTREITNVRAYLLTSLYNAPITIGTYYAAMVKAHESRSRGDPDSG